jgi:cytochrome c oxidase subunit II
MATEREETGREETPREERSHFLQLLVIGLIASVIGIALGLLIDWWPAQGSAEASQVDTLYDVLIICSVPMFVLVVTVVLYCAWRYRMKPGEEELDGPPIHGNTRLEIIWTAIPAIILVALCSYSFAVLTDIEDADARALNVRVVGEQFTWTFYYRDGSGKEIASPQLYVPQGQQVNFTVQSQDVIHDFWVPAFRVKIDAVPGINTHLRVTPDRVGDYPVICAELCGLGHSVMRQTAHVMPARDFQRWLDNGGKTDEQAQAEQDADTGAGGGAPDGKTLFTENNCGACHALADAGTTGGTGPDLDDVLADKDAAFIKESITDPGAEIAPGFSDGIMPTNFGQTLEPAELDALVKYLDDVSGK